MTQRASWPYAPSTATPALEAPLITRRTHEAIVSQLRAQINDQRGDLQRLQETVEAKERVVERLLDKVLALTKPSAAAVLHPREIHLERAPESQLGRQVEEDQVPPPPDDILLWIEQQGAKLAPGSEVKQ